MKSRAVTYTYSEVTSILELPVYIARTVKESRIKQLPKKKAVWDTGCVMTCISGNAVKQMGIAPSGTTEIISITETKVVNTYNILVFLDDDFYFDLNAREMQLNDFDILLGMDVIQQGDFAITHGSGKTVVSFMVPPRNTIDFEE